MAYTAIVGRRIDRPVINLGFSGNGQTEPEVVLAELALGSSGSPLALLSDEDPFQALTAAAQEGSR